SNKDQTMSFLAKPLLSICLLTIAGSGQWVKQPVATEASFRGLSVVSSKIVWASGTGGTVVRTIDGGRTWNVIAVPGAEKLDFRDIEAFDATTAYVLSIGNGDASRIYKTVDGGKSWSLQFTNSEESAFYDALACWDRTNCIAMSDPVDGFYRLLETRNGMDWKIIDTEKMDNAKPGEAAFAASGTCLIAVGKSTAFLVTGGSDARVFRSDDRGWTWSVAETPVVKGTPGSGIFSIAMRDKKRGVIVGGNYEKPDEAVSNIALTTDGGKRWTASTGLTGYRSGVAYIDKQTVIAVGTNGSDISRDSGKTWEKLGAESLNAVAAAGNRSVWAAGPKGGVFRLRQ
ncbi:MAG TPA: hypothetical protein VK918_05075, partial [Pyrinomonadaceae bacterium]|nr:hypothetical protein [Pyrinomonadaceae bacterium]